MFEMHIGSCTVNYDGPRAAAANIMSDLGLTPYVTSRSNHSPLAYHAHYGDVMVVINENNPLSFRAIRPAFGLDVSYLKGDVSYLNPDIARKITPTSPWEIVYNKGSFFTPITISSPCWVIPRQYGMSLICFLDQADHMEWRLNQ